MMPVKPAAAAAAASLKAAAAAAAAASLKAAAGAQAAAGLNAASEACRHMASEACHAGDTRCGYKGLGLGFRAQP
jgi:hypothetical protein